MLSSVLSCGLLIETLSWQLTYCMSQKSQYTHSGCFPPFAFYGKKIQNQMSHSMIGAVQNADGCLCRFILLTPSR
ncbi:uncharacterized protein GGS25DRAFT_494981 [Hypoxylon fragiforme]|uniref:uncharacterized protein n=1 Tax=Hypoxylon fragiforme TaxID=63214 RepID=UPI0020C6AC68|nr:uncharacterized protein GGS25DRAFT_494981 [Hypoxylon fragiforme]KAI2607261.1 hypothetical protein GGS25DRAFT_494981 [Hypoxylon fragiforme]